MISVLIGVLIICVVGAICFWAIEKFVNDSRLANLLKILVVLICVGAILQRVLPLAGINCFSGRSGLGGATMHMSNESLLVVLFVGLVAGWLAGQIVRGAGFDLSAI